MPVPAILFFLLTVVLTLLLLLKACGVWKVAAVVSLLWLALQSSVALAGFYRVATFKPPHLLFAIAPPLLLLLLAFLTAAGRRFLDRMELKWLVLLHSIRVLVELNLLWLFLHKQVPIQMTFEAGNLDILSGFTAPLAWWAYQSGLIRRNGLLLWNTLALAGLSNAVGRALLSVPSPFQRLGFSQPNVAILSFPYILLPAFIVPAVLLCHLAVYRKLLLPVSTIR